MVVWITWSSFLTDRSQTSGGKKELRFSGAPTKSALADMEMHGCAIVRGSNRSQQSDLEFDSNWTFDETDQFLRRLFPHVFDHADNLTEGPAAKMKVGMGKPTWVLLSREKGKLRLVPGVPYPNGNDLDQFKGRTSAGMSDSHIYIGKLLQSLTC